jgi:hypothetical protein
MDIFEKVSDANEFNSKGGNEYEKNKNKAGSSAAYEIMDELRNRKKIYYKKLYDKCMRNVLDASRKNKKEYLYKIPEVVNDFQYYDNLDFTYHMIKSLRNDGFFVSYVDPGYIIIRFSLIDSDIKKEKYINFLAKENIKTMLLYKFMGKISGITYKGLEYAVKNTPQIKNEPEKNNNGIKNKELLELI